MKAIIPDQTAEGRTTAVSAANSLGDQLRRAREARGIPLREISEQTRISIRYLEAIESGEYKQLPGGIFNRSFVKAYARYVGLDEKEALEAYARTARERGEPAEDAPPVMHHSRVYTNDQQTRSPLVNALLTILVLAILSLGVYAALRGYQRRTQPPEAAAPTAAASQPLPAAPAPTAAAPVAEFRIEVAAGAEPIWLRVREGDAPSTEMTLQPGNPREYTPQDRLTLWYSKSRARSLEVKINGRPAKVPTEPKGKATLVEMGITKDDYNQLLQ